MYPKGSAALALAREGLRVFRLPEDSNDREVKELKKPFSYYTKEATHDPDKIKSWWRQGNYNIGVFLTGTDFFAVDYDMDPGEDGEQAFKLHEATWPKTRIARTQSGGYHRYYKLPPGWYVRSQQTFGDFKNVQIKGNGTNCYVVGPGSTIHGRKYEWINPDQEFTEVDDEFIQQFEETNKPELRKKANSTPLCEPDTPEILAAVAQYITGDAPVAHQGNRDNTAYKVACQVKNYGASPETALNALFEWNGTKCNPPLDSDVIETKVDSAYKNSQRPQGDDAPSVRLERAREEFDVVSLPGDEGRAPSRDDDFGDPIDLWAEEQTPPDLPPGLLPPALEDFVADEAERKGVERGAVALAALVSVRRRRRPALKCK
ncbi:MAG: bifunctional DNA primase/polymerase [Xanthobacteraceae bacterium]